MNDVITKLYQGCHFQDHTEGTIVNKIVERLPTFGAQTKKSRLSLFQKSGNQTHEFVCLADKSLVAH